MFDIYKINPNYVFPEFLSSLKPGQRVTQEKLERAVKEYLEDLEGYAYRLFAYSCKHISENPIEFVGEFPPYDFLHIDEATLSKHFKTGLTKENLVEAYPSKEDQDFLNGILLTVAVSMLRLDVTMEDVIEIKVSRWYQFIVRYRKDGIIKTTEPAFPNRSVEECQKLDECYKFFAEAFCLECKRTEINTLCGAEIPPENIKVYKPVQPLVTEPVKVEEEIIEPLVETPIETPLETEELKMEEPLAKEAEETDHLITICIESASFDRGTMNDVDIACHVLKRFLELYNGVVKDWDTYRQACRHWKVDGHTYCRIARVMKQSKLYDKTTGQLSINFTNVPIIKSRYNTLDKEIRAYAAAIRAESMTKETNQQLKEETSMSQDAQTQATFTAHTETEDTLSDFIFSCESLTFVMTEIHKWKNEKVALQAKNRELTARLSTIEGENTAKSSLLEKENTDLKNKNKALVDRIRELEAKVEKVKSVIS